MKRREKEKRREYLTSTHQTGLEVFINLPWVRLQQEEREKQAEKNKTGKGKRPLENHLCHFNDQRKERKARKDLKKGIGKTTEKQGPQGLNIRLGSSTGSVKVSLSQNALYSSSFREGRRSRNRWKKKIKNQTKERNGGPTTRGVIETQRSK